MHLPFMSVREAKHLARSLGIRYELKGKSHLFYIPGHRTPIPAPLQDNYTVRVSLSKALLNYKELLSSNSSNSHLTAAAGTALSTKTYSQLGSPPSNSSALLPPPVRPSSSLDRTLAAKRTPPTSPSSDAQAPSSDAPPSPSSPTPQSPSRATCPTPPAATPTRTTPPPRSSTGRAYLSSLETWGPSCPSTPARPSSASVPPPAPTSTTSSERSPSPSTRASASPDGPSIFQYLNNQFLDRVPSPSPSSAPTTRPSSLGTRQPPAPSPLTSGSSSSGSTAPSPSSPSPTSSPPSHPRSSSMSGSSTNKLTQPEFYRLCEYLKSRKSDLESNPYTLVKLAEQASASLKLLVATGSVSNALSTVGITLKVSHTSRHGINQAAAIRTLARAHLQLCRDLGNHCPPEIELMAQE